MKNYAVWAEPATGHQKQAICRLAMALGIRHEIEQEQMTKGVARRMMFELRNRLRTRKR